MEYGPQLKRILPSQGYAGVPNDVTLYGSYLAPATLFRMGGQLLQNIWISSSGEANGFLPSGLPVGIYDVAAQSPGVEMQSVLPGAYTVLDPAGDDFYAAAEDLWLDPAAARQGNPAQIGINVHRQGGQEARQVTVAFYQVVAGTRQEIARIQSAPIPAGVENVVTVLAPWNTSGLAGSVELVAVIDPDNTLGEAARNNNSVGGTIVLLPPAADTRAPVINSLTVNDGAAATTDSALTVRIAAADPGGSGIKAMHLVEREFNSAARQWVAIQQSGWMSFTDTHAWVLTGRGGTRYLQASVSDEAGNISPAAVTARIDYMPAIDTLQQGQVRLYRRTLRAGESIAVVLQTLSGDADLYVWTPDGGQSWVSNQASGEDAASFTALLAGDYQIEVYAYAASTYHLVVTSGAATAATAAGDQLPAALDPTKSVRSQPIVAPGSQPASTFAVPAAPAGQPAQPFGLYLPAVRR